MARLVINSVAELKNFQRKLRSVIGAFPIIQKNAIDDYATNDILKQIKTKMNAEDFSQKIIDATFVGPVNITDKKIQIHYISDYVADNGFDVSNAREEGTEDGVTRRPKNPAGSLRWFAPTGEPIFRKSSTPNGMERLLIIGKTIKQNENQAVKKYGESLAESASKLLGV